MSVSAKGVTVHEILLELNLTSTPIILQVTLSTIRASSPASWELGVVRLLILMCWCTFLARHGQEGLALADHTFVKRFSLCIMQSAGQDNLIWKAPCK